MECVFCHKEKLVTDIVYEDELVMAFMDMDPINEGHVLLVPKEHYLDADGISATISVNISFNVGIKENRICHKRNI